MKNLLIIFLFLFAVSITAVAQQIPEDPIRTYDGIPIVAGLDYYWITRPNGLTGNPGAVDTMKNIAGIDAVNVNIDRFGQVDTLTGTREYPYNFGFDLMVQRMLGFNKNYIRHYSHGKYSVWEAEGNENYEVNLVRQSAKTEIDASGTFVRRRGDVLNSIDEMIYGPYPWYYQDVRYHDSQDGYCRIVPYTAEFRLMIEANDPPVAYNPDDIICTIQVTQRIVGGCTYVIKERLIKRGEFNGLNQFQEFKLDPNPLSTFDYKLTSDLCQETSRPIPDSTDCGTILLRSNVEYKVIWKGKSNSQGYPAYLLSVDKVTLSDLRGREITDTLVTPNFATQLIIEQDNTLDDFYSNIAGYIGPDEPRSIDLFEPMRIVTGILDDHSQLERPFWLFYATGTNSFNSEFSQRVGRANLMVPNLMFDIPCRPDIVCDDCPPGSEDYRSKNIRLMANRYKDAYELDPYYGINLQTGSSRPPYGECSHMRNINRDELLYSANLALLNGAKFLAFSVQGYFAQTRTEDESSLDAANHAVVDFDPDIYHTIYTDKFYMIRDTLNPRLEGLFGKY